MSNSRKISPKLMLRVQACAILFMASKRKECIERIAEAKGIELEQAAIMYTLGALKRAKRQGVAKNYTQALDNLEAEQVGDRGNPITKSRQADKMSRYIDKLNRKNKGDVIVMDKVKYIHDYDFTFMERLPLAPIVAIIPKQLTPHFEVIDIKEKKQNMRNVGRVLGTLYAKWEEQTEQYNPINIITNRELDAKRAQVEKNLSLYFADYSARLSNTSYKLLKEIAQSDIKPTILMSDEGLKSDNKELKKLSWQAYTLYKGFPHKDAITGCQFIELIRQYINDDKPYDTQTVQSAMITHNINTDIALGIPT